MPWPLLVALFLLCLVGVLLWHARIPPTVNDYWKLQTTEILLRVFNEYLGDVVETLFGARVRNAYFRLLMAIGFLLPTKEPEDVKISTALFRGTSTLVYQPRARSSDAAVVFIHGGGWCTMRARYYDDVLLSLARRLGCVCFSIDYRLAPESPFPAPADECEAVVRELWQNKYVEYGVNRDRIALVGDSAGGNLTAVTANRLLREGCKALKCSVLIYPVTQVFAFDLPCHQLYYSQYNHTALLNPRAMARWSLMYMGMRAEREDCDKLLRMKHVIREMREDPVYSSRLDTRKLPKEFQTGEVRTGGEVDEALASEIWKRGANPDISPLFERSLKGQCPTMLITAGWDVLRDEGILYGKRLEEDGVQVDWRHYPQAFHGLFNMPRSLHKKQMLKDVCQYLTAQL